MSCFQSRQSKEMDSVNCATSAAGPDAKRPLRETGDFLFIRWLVFNAKTQRRQAAKSFLLCGLAPLHETGLKNHVASTARM